MRLNKYGVVAVAVVVIGLYATVRFLMGPDYSIYSQRTLSRFISKNQAEDLGELFEWLERKFPTGTPAVAVEEFFRSRADEHFEGWWILPMGVEDLRPALGEKHWWVGASCVSKGKGYSNTEALKAELDDELRVLRWSGESGALVGNVTVKDGQIVMGTEDTSGGRE